MVELQANNLVLPQNQTMEHFNQGATTAESVENSQFERAKQGMEMLAGAAYGVLGNNLDGKADPQQWEQTLDFFEQRGLPVKNWRGRPDLANVVARSSLNVLSSAQNEEQLDQGWKRLEQDIAQAAAGGEAPASVREWEYFNALSPEQQSQYLIMKRSNPYLNQGTQFVAPNPASPGETLGPAIPINNELESFQKAFGSEAGTAAAARILALPGALAKADNMMATIDSILNDPALDSSTGWLSWMQAVPGTDQYRFGQKALQLQGQAFLQAFESLKGGGAITQVEGVKAEQAIGRLSTAQKPEDYREALEELKGIINAAKARTVENANTSITSTAATPAGGTPDPALPVPDTPGTPDDDMDPATMSDEDLLTFLGAN